MSIVITVDDFGPNPEVNERAFALFEAGVVDRVSAIVNIPWAPETAGKVKELGIPVGLHLNISSGLCSAPIEEVSSLVDEKGSFLVRNRGRDLSHIDSRDIDREFRAQLRQFHAHELSLSHLDCHRPEIYLFPQLLEPAMDLAQQARVQFRQPLRNMRLEDREQLARSYGCLESELERLQKCYDKAMAKRGLSCPDFFLSDGTLGGLEPTLKMVEQRMMKGVCEIAIHLDGERGQTNFMFATAYPRR